MPLSSKVKHLFRFMEGLFHSVRRRRATERVGRIREVRTVVFLCYGNICRSPFAEHAFQRHQTDERLRAISRGLYGPDRFCPSTAEAVAKRFGVDLSQHRSSLVTTEDLRTSDVIVVMDASHAKGAVAAYPEAKDRIIMLGDLDPREWQTRNIRDPYGKDESTFDNVYRRIDRCVSRLSTLLRGNPSTS